MNLKHIAAAALLATAGSAALAATSPLDPLTPSASFANTVIGAFEDVWTFNLSTESAVAASLTNVEVTFAGNTSGGIDGFQAFLNGVELLESTSTQTPGSGVSFTTQVLSGATTLPAGMYQLRVVGTGITGANASYGGNIVAVPVPEPETYAMMLAGLAAVGFVAARRRRQG